MSSLGDGTDGERHGASSSSQSPCQSPPRPVPGRDLGVDVGGVHRPARKALDAQKLMMMRRQEQRRRRRHAQSSSETNHTERLESELSKEGHRASANETLPSAVPPTKAASRPKGTSKLEEGKPTVKLNSAMSGSGKTESHQSSDAVNAGASRTEQNTPSLIAERGKNSSHHDTCKEESCVPGKGQSPKSTAPSPSSEVSRNPLGKNATAKIVDSANDEQQYSTLSPLSLLQQNNGSNAGSAMKGKSVTVRKGTNRTNRVEIGRKQNTNNSLPVTLEGEGCGGDSGNAERLRGAKTHALEVGPAAKRSIEKDGNCGARSRRHQDQRPTTAAQQQLSDGSSARIARKGEGPPNRARQKEKSPRAAAPVSGNDTNNSSAWVLEKQRPHSSRPRGKKEEGVESNGGPSAWVSEKQRPHRSRERGKGEGVAMDDGPSAWVREKQRPHRSRARGRGEGVGSNDRASSWVREKQGPHRGASDGQDWMIIKGGQRYARGGAASREKRNAARPDAAEGGEEREEEIEINDEEEAQRNAQDYEEATVSLVGAHRIPGANGGDVDDDEEEPFSEGSVSNFNPMASNNSIEGNSDKTLEIVAVAVEDDDDANREVVYANAEYMPTSARLLLEDKKLRRMCCCLMLTLVVCAVSISVGVTVKIGKSRMNGDTSNATEAGGSDIGNMQGGYDDNLGPWGPPTAAPSNPAPTASPSPAPTVSIAPTVDLAALKDAFEKLGSARSDLDDPDSPQHRAMLWMSFTDSTSMGRDEPMYYQRYVAVVLYYSLEGPGWIVQDDWLNSGEHECLWGRTITCQTYTGRQYVSVLDLSGYDAAGEVPPEIGMLERLEGLYLNQNNIVGTIPERICDLSSLSVLDLAENALSGTLPDCIGKLTSVTTLDLSANALTGPLAEGLWDMRNLRILHLSYNEFTGSISSKLNQLQTLVVADVRGNQLTGTMPLTFGDLADLAFMYLDNNLISGSVPFFTTYFGRREEITLSNNLLTGTLPWGIPTKENALGEELENNQFRLNKIDFSRNVLSGPLPALIGLVPSLQYVDASANRFTGSIPLTYGKNGLMHGIEHIALANNELVGTIPEMGNAGNTRHIDLKGNNLVGGLPDFLWKFSKLEYLDLGENPLGGRLPDRIGNSPVANSLIHLRLHGCQLEGNIPVSFGRLVTLGYLDLGDNALDGTIPGMGNLYQLTELVLGRNELMGTIPADLGQLAKARILDLSRNDLVGTVPETFGQLRLIEDMHLEENRLTGSMPKAMCSLSERNVFNVDCKEVQCDCCEGCS